jgi:hypothetical protein
MTVPRIVDVRPPSRSGEGFRVLRAIMWIAFAALLVIALRRDGGIFGGGGLRAQDLAPFQKLFRDVDADLQHAYRQMQEGLIEAEGMRSATKSWPTPEVLAALEVPPFAEDPIAKVPLAWTLEQEGDFVNYRGIPAASTAPELLALIQEPAPGANEVLGPRSPPDETHHVLADGTVLHVTIWFRPPDAAPLEGTVTRPFAQGFFQILSGNTP